MTMNDAPPARTAVAQSAARATSRSPWFALAAMSALSGVLAFAGAKWLFPLGSRNQDDAIYRLFADMLRHGNATLPEDIGPLRPWASGYANGRVVLVYQPVWPAMIMIATVLFGSAYMALALLAGATTASTALFVRELMGEWRYALAAGALMMSTPLFLVQSSLFLSYLPQLLFTTVCLTLLVRGLRTSGRTPLLLAGLVFGIAVWARLYDGVLLGVAIALWAVCFQRTRARTMIRQTALLGAGAALPIVLMELYAWKTLGSPLKTHFGVLGAANRPGFGMRGIRDGYEFDFTFSKGVDATQLNLRALPGWLFGGVLALPLIVYGAKRAVARSAAAWLPIFVAVAIVVGYGAFWSPYSLVKGWGGQRDMGPFYHMLLLIGVVSFAAVGLVDLARRRPSAAVLAAGAMAVITAWGIPAKVDINRATTRVYEEQKARLDALPAPRLIFVDGRVDLGFAVPIPFVQNRPDLSGPNIVAQDDGEWNFDLIDRFPGHAPVGLYFFPSDKGYDTVPFALERVRAHRFVVDIADSGDDSGRGETFVRLWPSGETVASRTIGDERVAQWQFAAATSVDTRGAVVALSGRGLVEVGIDLFAPDGTRTLTRGVTYIYRVVGGEIEVVTPPRYWKVDANDIWTYDNGGPLVSHLRS